MLWTEKYRPKRIQELIGQELFKLDAENWIENKEMPNLLLYGGAGVGKTTAADGSVVVNFDKDVHYLTGVSVADTIYIVAETNAGTATADVVVNWRA